MNEFESDWITYESNGGEGSVQWRVFCANGGTSKQVWVSLTGKTKVSEYKMAEFKMAAIIKLSQNEWVKDFFVQMVGTNLGKWEWVWKEKLRFGWIQDGI